MKRGITVTDILQVVQATKNAKEGIHTVLVPFEYELGLHGSVAFDHLHTTASFPPFCLQYEAQFQLVI
jgi:hypothetical protein